MAYEGLTPELLTRMPELVLPYRQVLRQWSGDQPGQHIVFEAVLVPFLFSELRSSKAKPLLKKAFELLGDMAYPSGRILYPHSHDASR